jgi:hypothetical protein
MFFVTTGVLFSVLALARATITSPTESTVWSSGDQVTVNWDPSKTEDDSPGKLVLGQPEDDSDNLDLDNPLAQDFPLSAGSVQFTVPDLSSGSDYIVVLFAGDSDDGDASPQFTINGQPKLVKKAPQEMPDSDPTDPTDTPDTPDTPDGDPTGPADPADPGTETGPSASSPASSGAPTSPAAATAPPAGATTSAPAATTPSTPKNATSTSSTSPLAANSSSLNPSTTGSGSGANGALSFAQAHHIGAISLSAAVAAMGLVFAF